MDGNTDLLERAVSYTLSVVDTVTPDVMCRQTPCVGWDLHMLMTHLCASVDALSEGLHCDRVLLFPADVEPIADPAAELRARVIRLLDDWPARFGTGRVDVADMSMPPEMLAAVASIELAVHAWDMSQASGRCDPVPDALARDLLALSRTLIPDDNRHHLFAPAIPLATQAGPADQLLAFLGRRPGREQL